MIAALVGLQLALCTGAAIAADPPPQGARPEIQPIPPLSRWPSGATVHVAYRIIGSYGTLQSRLARPIKLRQIDWGPEFLAFARVDVESALRGALDAHSKISGLTLVGAKASEAPTTQPDIVIDLYESDRLEDVSPFFLLRQISKAQAPEITRDDYSIPSGWARVYRNDHRVTGGACLLALSAFTYRERLTLALLADRGNMESLHSKGPPPFGTFITRNQPEPTRWLSRYDAAISQKRFSFVGTLLGGSYPRCQRDLQNGYSDEWKQAIEACLATVLGLPASNVGPNELRTRLNLRFADPDQFEQGSGRWVSIVGSQMAGHHDKSAYYGSTSAHSRELLAALYRKDATSAGPAIEELSRLIASTDHQATKTKDKTPRMGSCFR